VAAGDAPDDARALDRAVRALARRDHSAAGLRAKLGRAGIPDDAQAAAVDKLECAGYLDDARFARDRAVQLAKRGYGDDWIRSDLDAQGIEVETAEQAVGSLEPEAERATRAAAKAGGGLRAARSLARRGFTEDALEAVVAELVAEDLVEGVG